MPLMSSSLTSSSTSQLRASGPQSRPSRSPATDGCTRSPAGSCDRVQPRLSDRALHRRIRGGIPMKTDLNPLVGQAHRRHQARIAPGLGAGNRRSTLNPAFVAPQCPRSPTTPFAASSTQAPHRHPVPRPARSLEGRPQRCPCPVPAKARMGAITPRGLFTRAHSSARPPRDLHIAAIHLRSGAVTSGPMPMGRPPRRSARQGCPHVDRAPRSNEQRQPTRHQMPFPAPVRGHLAASSPARNGVRDLNMGT